MARERRVALRAQPTGALPLDDGAVELRHARRRRAGPRRKRNTCSCVRPHASTRSSERANIASVSVGKPAMISAPKATSGRSRRTESQNAIASWRVCRRFMRLRMKIVAGLQRQMQMRHQPRLVGQRVEQIAVGLDRVNRGQPQPRQLRNRLEQVLDQRAQPRSCRQIRAVTG